MTVPDVASVVAKIEDACNRAGRDPKSVKLLAVTKQVPVQTIREAAGMGITFFGENRVQEARLKTLEGAFLGSTLCLIGHLQSNKASIAARIFGEVHSIDSGKLAETLGRASVQYRKEPLPVLMEVNVSLDPAKFGVAPGGALELARVILKAPGLILRGMMTVAPASKDDDAARSAFKKLFLLREELKGAGVPEENLAELSMGMSGDYITAIEEGSTMVRIGTAIFGPRREG